MVLRALCTEDLGSYVAKTESSQGLVFPRASVSQLTWSMDNVTMTKGYYVPKALCTEGLGSYVPKMASSQGLMFPGLGLGVTLRKILSIYVQKSAIEPQRKDEPGIMGQQHRALETKVCSMVSAVVGREINLPKCTTTTAILLRMASHKQSNHVFVT